MIVPMKKVTIITQEKDADSAVKTLGQAGVLHVEHQRLPEGKDINDIQNDLEVIRKAIAILRKIEVKTKSYKEKEIGDFRFRARHVIDLEDRIGRLTEYSSATKKEIEKWKPWGDFDPAEIGALAEKNIYASLYKLPARGLGGFPGDAIVRKISAERGMANCVVISRRKIEMPFKELALPKLGISKMRARLAQDDKVIEMVKKDLKEQVSYISALVKVEKSLTEDLDMQKAASGMGRAGSITYLRGYIPYDAVSALMETAKREKWGISVKDPSPEDRVPTLIRNPKWISIIAPVFRMIEVVPGYHEFDTSLWFLVFLSVFFGMLIGDAGYGGIFFALTAFFHAKLGKKMPDKSPFILFYTLSLFAIIWGALTGTFFGQAWLAGIVKPLMPALRDNKNIQALCFLIGALHLSIGHVWKAVVKLPSPKALADLGWAAILWGAFFLAKTLILGENFPTFGKWFFICGPILVVVFTDLKRNVFKSIGFGLGNLLLNVVNSFTDVVSYIRLFAVGLATVAIADAFNKMAMSVGYSSVLSGFLTSIILIIGHALNILLGPLAVLVHGVRLNVLEFANHVDIKWSGFLYKPLKEEK